MHVNVRNITLKGRGLESKKTMGGNDVKTRINQNITIIIRRTN
jgi:hypothetical protein